MAASAPWQVAQSTRSMTPSGNETSPSVHDRGDCHHTAGRCGSRPSSAGHEVTQLMASSHAKFRIAPVKM
jgi:hypothetical protein